MRGYIMRLAVCALALLAGAGARPLSQQQPAGARGPVKVDVNTAPLELLLTLPGVTQDKASLIVAHRPYDSLEHFKKASGLSAADLDRLAPFVIASPQPPVRQPRLPPGAVPIDPELFLKDFKRGAVPPADGRSPGARGGVTPIPVPNGGMRPIPVPPGTIVKNIPVPGAERPPARQRDLRGAFIYGVTAVVVAIAALVYMRRTSPSRKTGRS